MPCSSFMKRLNHSNRARPTIRSPRNCLPRTASRIPPPPAFPPDRARCAPLNSGSTITENASARLTGFPVAIAAPKRQESTQPAHKRTSPVSSPYSYSRIDAIALTCTLPTLPGTESRHGSRFLPSKLWLCCSSVCPPCSAPSASPAYTVSSAWPRGRSSSPPMPLGATATHDHLHRSRYWGRRLCRCPCAFSRGLQGDPPRRSRTGTPSPRHGVRGRAF